MKTTRNVMRKALSWMLALLGTLTFSAPALAFNITRSRAVWIQAGGSGRWVNGGTWTLVDLDANIHGYCRYTLEWDSAGPEGLVVSGNVYLDEAKTGGHANCNLNMTQDFPTSIYLAPGPAVTGHVPSAPPSQGIDRFGQLVSLPFMSLSESLGWAHGLRGTVRFATGNVYAVAIF